MSKARQTTFDKISQNSVSSKNPKSADISFQRSMCVIYCRDLYLDLTGNTEEKGIRINRAIFEYFASLDERVAIVFL